MMNPKNNQHPLSHQPETGKKIKNYIYNYNDLIGKGNFARVFRGCNIKTRILSTYYRVNGRH